jgi:hypothetical protein
LIEIKSTSLRSLEAALHSSRRDFLKQVTTLACACCLSVEDSAQSTNQGPHPHLEFPTRPRDRLAVTSWPFRAYIAGAADSGRKPSVPSMDIKEFPAMVAERFAVYNVNPLLSHFSSTDSAYLESFREAVAKARSHIVDLGLEDVLRPPTPAPQRQPSRTAANGSISQPPSVLPAYGNTCRPKRGRSRTWTRPQFISRD